MKTKLFLFFFAVVLAWQLPVYASGQKLVNGAGTIPSRTFAFGFDMGYTLPEPLLFGMRLDAGVGDRFQIGIGGSVWGVVNAFGINTTSNIIKDADDTHFLSLYLNPYFLHFSNIFFDEEGTDTKVMVFFLQPGLAYEYRFGENHNTGLYLKAGTMHLIGATADGRFFGATWGTDSTLLTLSPGFQHNFGGSFALALEPVVYVALKQFQGATTGNTSSPFMVLGKASLTWTF